MSFAIGDSGIIFDTYNKKIKTNYYINENKTETNINALYRVDSGVVKSEIPEFNDAFTLSPLPYSSGYSYLLQGYSRATYDESNCCCIPAGMDSKTESPYNYVAGLVPSSALSCSTEQAIAGERYFVNSKINLERISKNVFAVHLIVSIEEGTDDSDNVPGYLSFEFDMKKVFDPLKIDGPINYNYRRGIGRIPLMELGNSQLTTGKFRWAMLSIEAQTLYVSLMQDYMDMQNETRLTAYEGNGYMFLPDDCLLPIVDNRPEPVRPARHILGNVNLDNVTTAIDGVDYDQLKCILYDKNEVGGCKYSYHNGDGTKIPFNAELPTTTSPGLIPIKPFVGEDAEIQPGCSLFTKDGKAYLGWQGKQEEFEGDLIIERYIIDAGAYDSVYDGPCKATFCQVGNNKILIFIPTEYLPMRVDTYAHGNGLIDNIIQLNIDWQEALWKFGREMILDQQMNDAHYDAVMYQCVMGDYQASISHQFNQYDSFLGQGLGYYSYGYNYPGSIYYPVPYFWEGFGTIVIELTFFDEQYNNYQE